MSSYLDDTIEFFRDKLGMPSRKATLNDALRQSPGAESEVNRTMTGVSPQQWDAMKLEKLTAPVQVHGMEAVKKLPRWQDALSPGPTGRNRPVVTLPTVNMVPEQSPRQMIAQQSTQPSAPVSEYKKPDQLEWGDDIITLLSEAEERARLPRRDMRIQGTGDGKGGTLYFGGNLGDRALTEDEAFEYIKQLDDYAKGAGFY